MQTLSPSIYTLTSYNGPVFCQKPSITRRICLRRGLAPNLHHGRIATATTHPITSTSHYIYNEEDTHQPHKTHAKRPHFVRGLPAASEAIPRRAHENIYIHSRINRIIARIWFCARRARFAVWYLVDDLCCSNL